MSNLYLHLTSGEHENVKKAEQACGAPLIGRFGIKNVANWYLLIGLSEFDQGFVESVPLKAGEIIARYVTSKTAIGDFYPLVKVNFERRLVYFLTQEAFDQGYTEFESRGEKVPWIIIADQQRVAA